MKPRILLVYANPAITATPVAPYGAERVAHAFRIAGCDARVIAPWLELRPAAALAAALDAFKPDLVGFSVRNVDDALVVRTADGPGDIDTAFYLPAIRPLVRGVQKRGIPVLIGGAAVATMGDAILGYLGVDFGIVGPAEDLVLALGRALASGVPFPEALPNHPQLLRAHPVLLSDGPATVLPDVLPALLSEPLPAGSTPRMPSYLRLAVARGGRVPVMYSEGCDRRCHFCVEASFLGGRVRTRPAGAIVAEIAQLAQKGVRRVWLTASELNVPHAGHAVVVLRALAAANLGVDVLGFLQPAPVDDALLDAFTDVGVDPSSLAFEFGHLDDTLLRAGAGPANRASIDRLVELYLRRGHRILGGSILLGAHPKETVESVDRALDAARTYDAALPDGLGLAYAAGGRVYPAAPLGRWVRANLEAARPHLFGRYTPEMVEPLVYCRPFAPRALLAYIQQGLAGCKGPIAPLNAEASASPVALSAEKWVNLTILRAADGNIAGAERAARAALARVPAHPEALKQLGLLLANQKGDLEGAIGVFQRLLGALHKAGAPTADSAEIQSVIRSLQDLSRASLPAG